VAAGGTPCGVTVALPHILYVLGRSITESPNANAYQKPLGLARAFNVTMLAPKGAAIPPDIAACCRVRRLPSPELGGRSPLRMARFVHAAISGAFLMHSRGRAQAICTGVDEVSLAVGWLTRTALRLPWIVCCWDHPYPVQAERSDALSRCLGGVRRVLMRRLLARSSMICCGIDPGVLDELRLVGPRLFSVPNGVSVERISRAGGGSTVDEGLVGVVANVSREKGAGLVIDAMHLVRRSLPQARLRLIGEVEAGFRDELGARIRRLQLDSAVEVTEWQPYERAMKLAAECSICLYAYRPLPRFYWNYVLKIGEYCALGKSVVAVDTPGARAYITQGHNGLLVPPEDPAAMAGAICRLLGDRCLRERMARRARKVAARLDWDAVHDRTNAEILSVLKSEGALK